MDEDLKRRRPKYLDRVGPTGPWVLVADIFLGLAGLVAVVALAMEHGFARPPVPVWMLHIAETSAVGMFIVDRLVRLLFAQNRKRYLRGNWVDFVLIAVAILAVPISYWSYANIVGAGALYVVITQVYLLGVLVVRAAALNKRVAESGVHPAWLVIGSFAVVCLVGSGLLMLPVATPAQHTPDFYQDALFTAVSATCVTGLITVDTGSDYTFFGQAVILVLIQIGGLGFMIFGTMLGMVIGKSLSVRGSEAMGQMLATEGAGDLRRTLRFVVATTFVFETIGMLLLLPMYLSLRGADGQILLTTGQAIWYSVFHSISAFCNAGFSLHDANLFAGVQEGWATPIRQQWQVLGVVAPLIILGGLGFPVLEDCASYIRAMIRWLRKRRTKQTAASTGARPRLTLHSRIVLVTTAMLLVIGTIGAFALNGPPRGSPHGNPMHGAAAEAQADFRQMPFWPKLRESVFQSVTARTAGFNTVDMEELSPAGKLWVCGLMMVGGSPAGTAGGMKTITFAMLLLAVYNAIRRRKDVEAFRRRIANDLLLKSLMIAVLYVTLLFVVTLGLCVTTGKDDFIGLMFEAFSACGTVGLATPSVSDAVSHSLGAKVVVIFAMFLGRLGPLTLLTALSSGVRSAKYSYPEENIILG